MRIESASIRGFKLLEDVRLRFSTDSNRPLTVIRAENGSGKTSILYALRWGMYGKDGIPDGMRLTSIAAEPRKPVSVEVQITLADSDPLSGEGEEARYRLIRICSETPREGDWFDRDMETLRLLRLTDKGEEHIEEGKEALIAKLLPLSLADVFFTNGDDVQRFISGNQQSERERQAAVHDAIRQVLGLEDVESAEKHLSAIAAEFKRELANTGGNELKEAQDELDAVQRQINEKAEELSKIRRRTTQVEEQIRIDERELNGLRGIGDLESIQARIRELRSDLQHLDKQEKDIRRQMKERLQSESLSWQFIGDRLHKGVEKLNRLADSKVIPGASVEILADRLELGECICGESLILGDSRHTYVKNLIDEQRQIAPERQRLTALWHHARNSLNSERNAADGNRSFVGHAAELKEQLVNCNDRKQLKELELKTEDEKRAKIDVERVRFLHERIQANRGKRSEFERNYGQTEARIQVLEQEMQRCTAKVDRAEKTANLNKKVRSQHEAASDLSQLAKGTLELLKSEYVQRVSTRMNELFLKIVGSTPEADAAVFTGVSINSHYDIVVHTQGGKTLDTSTELNGASQRALTLAFIWALMEVAEWEAPRIIDTPLGMTSGAVKLRMVDMLAIPGTADGLSSQTVLFMTRSEIRDIEDLIDSRAGCVSTLTCSKDFPVDLVNEWESTNPIVRLCDCSHKEICCICERRYDAMSNRYTRRTATQS